MESESEHETEFELTPQSSSSKKLFDSFESYFLYDCLEEKFTKESLIKFYNHFMENEYNEIDEKTLTTILDYGKEILSIDLTTEDSEKLFKKIDYNGKGYITIHDFISYLRIEFDQKYHSSKWKDLEEPPVHLSEIVKTKHYSMIRKTVLHVDLSPITSKIVQNCYITLSEDGTVDFWSLKFKHEKKVKCKNPDLKTVSIKITDMIVLSNVQMLCISSVEMILQFYDISGDKFMLQKIIYNFPFPIVKMHYSFGLKKTEPSFITLGDTGGNVLKMRFTPSKKVPFKQYLCEAVDRINYDSVKKGSVTGLKVKEFKRVHCNWVNQVHYYRELSVFVSCSDCKKFSVMVANPSEFEKQNYAFKVRKGVSCFDLCEESRIFVTGGRDQIIRIWDPFDPYKTIARLKGHRSEICAIFVKNEGKRLLSMSKNRTIKVWNLKNYECTQTFIDLPEELKMPVCVIYNDFDHKMYIASSLIAVVKCKRVIDPLLSDGYTHGTPVSVVLYNGLYKTILTMGRNSTIKVWNPLTGEQLNAIKKAHFIKNHGKRMPVGITAACFDASEHFLLTGARNGTLKIWDFNVGTCLNSMNVNDKSCITGVVWFENKILCAGWNRCLTEFEEVQHSEGKSWQTKHTDDIVGMTEYNSEFLVTGSYNGELIFWDLNTNQPYKTYQVDTPLEKHKTWHERLSWVPGMAQNTIIICPQKSKTTTKEITPKKITSIRALFFLNSRKIETKDSDPKIGTLIVSLESGLVQVWSHHKKVGFLESFSVIHIRGDYAESLASDPENKYVITGLLSGYIKVWLFENYLTSDAPEINMSILKKQFPFIKNDELINPAKMVAAKQSAPLLLNSFRGHFKCITSLQIVPQTLIIISGSVDCTVRLWTLNGQYLYTIGTNKDWFPLLQNPEDNLDNPRIPADIERVASASTLNVFKGGHSSQAPKDEKIYIKRITVDFSVQEKSGLITKPLSEPLFGNYYSTIGNVKEHITKPVINTAICVSVYNHLKIYDVPSLQMNEHAKNEILRLTNKK